MGTGAMRLNESRKCPAVACGFEINPFVIARTQVNPTDTDFRLECPVCGQIWTEIRKSDGS